MGRVGGAEQHASRATANVRCSSEARERGAVAEAGPGARHNAPLCVMGCAKRTRATTHNGRRYVDWPLRPDHGHGPSLRGKRDGQLPGTAEKTAMLPKPPAAAKAERSSSRRRSEGARLAASLSQAACLSGREVAVSILPPFFPELRPPRTPIRAESIGRSPLKNAGASRAS